MPEPRSPARCRCDRTSCRAGPVRPMTWSTGRHLRRGTRRPRCSSAGRRPARRSRGTGPRSRGARRGDGTAAIPPDGGLPASAAVEPGPAPDGAAGAPDARDRWNATDAIVSAASVPVRNGSASGRGVTQSSATQSSVTVPRGCRAGAVSGSRGSVERALPECSCPATSRGYAFRRPSGLTVRHGFDVAELLERIGVDDHL